MERHEALVFKVFDPDAGKIARFTAHTAFDDPQHAGRRVAAREHRDQDVCVFD